MGGARQARAVEPPKEGPQGRNGAVNPLGLGPRGTIISLLVLQRVQKNNSSLNFTITNTDQIISTLHTAAFSEDHLIPTLSSDASVFRRPACLQNAHYSVFRRCLCGLQHHLFFVTFAYASDWLFSCPSWVEKETFH